MKIEENLFKLAYYEGYFDGYRQGVYCSDVGKEDCILPDENYDGWISSKVLVELTEYNKDKNVELESLLRVAYTEGFNCGHKVDNHV